MKKNIRPHLGDYSTGLPADYKSDERILSPIPGLVTQVFIKIGDRLHPGDPILVIEAMKMRNMLRSGHEVTVSALHVEPGKIVQAGDILVEFSKGE